MTNLQSVSEMRDVLSITDATVTGILIVIVIAFGLAIIYLFKHIQQLNKEFVSELKLSNGELVKMNNSYNLFVSNMIELRKNSP